MNFARVAVAAVVAWIVSLGIGYLSNQVLFKDLFTPPFQRPEAQMNGLLPIGFVFLLVGRLVFAYAYAKYVATGGAMQGIRFGCRSPSSPTALP